MIKFIFLFLIINATTVNAKDSHRDAQGNELINQSVFYTPPVNENSAELSLETKYKRTHKITHKSSIETTLGGNSNGSKDNINFVQNPRGRINTRTAIEIHDANEKYHAVLDFTLGSNSYDDTSSMISINHGYVELRNVQTQPIQMKMRLGLQQTVGTNLVVNSATPMKNDQGVNGNWFRFAAMPTIGNTGYNPIFILQSKPLTAQGFASSQFLSDGLNYAQPSPYWSYSNAGINFTTERYSGFKLGFSYQPTTNNFANPSLDRRGNSFINQQQMFMKDITSVAINYLNEWRGIVLNTSISGEFAAIEKSQSASFTRNDLAQYSFGTNISYAGLTLGGSYANAGKSLLIQNDLKQVDSQNAYTADFGMSYAIGTYQFGVSHIQTNFVNNKMNTTVVSLSEDLFNSGKVKLTSIYELGFYDFASGSYFNGGGVLTAAPRLSGTFVSIGLRAGF